MENMSQGLEISEKEQTLLSRLEGGENGTEAGKDKPEPFSEGLECHIKEGLPYSTVDANVQVLMSLYGREDQENMCLLFQDVEVLLRRGCRKGYANSSF